MLLIKTFILSLALISVNVYAVDKKFPELACLYEMQTIDVAEHHHKDESSKVKTSIWRLWRYQNKVQISHANAPVGEVWQLLKNGEMRYTWLFHKEKFAINYEPTDLKTILNNPKWQTKASMISPDLLTYLKKEKTDTFQGEVAEHYQGKIGAYDLEVVWLPRLQLPAMIKQQHEGIVQRVQLKAFYPVNEVSWKAEDYNAYDDIDFSDIGDNESNPILNKYMDSMSFTGPHQH